MMPDLLRAAHIMRTRGVPRKLKEPVFHEHDHRPDPAWKSCPLASCAHNNWCRYPEECAAKKEGSE